MSSFPFQESTTTATLPRDLRHRRHDHRYLCSRAAHEHRDPAQPDPAGPVVAGESSHAPAVLRNSALQIGGHVGAIALTAASTIVLTRFLGVDDYGRFTVLTVFLLIGASLSEFGLNGTAIRWFASGERPEDVFASLIGLRLVLSSAAAVVALAIFALYPHSETPLSAVILTTIAMVLAGVNLTIPTALQARLDFRLAVVLDLTARAVTFAVFVAAALIVTSEDADRRLVAAAFALPAGYLVAVVVGLVAVRRLSFPIVPTFHPATWRRLLRDAAPLGVVMILGPRELPARRARARAPEGLVCRRHLRARLPLHGGRDPDRRLHHVRDLPAARPRRGRSRAPRRCRSRGRPTSCSSSRSRSPSARSCSRPTSSVLLGGEAYAPSVVPLRILVLSLPFTFIGMILSWTLIARGLQHRLIPIVAARPDAQPRTQPRARADLLLQGVGGRHARDRGARRVRARVLRPALARRQPVTRLGRPRSWRAEASRSGPASSARRSSDIVGTVVAIAVFAGLVLALGLVTRDEIDRAHCAGAAEAQLRDARLAQERARAARA